MESSTPTEPQAPKPVAPESSREAAAERAATRSELRTLRRWLLVTGIWAVAATAIAVVAYLEARDTRNEQDSAVSATQADIDRVQARLRGDVDELRTDLAQRPTRAEISQLQTRLRKAQRDATAARDDATKASDDVAELRPKVEALEREVDALQAAADGDSTAGN